MLSTFESFDIAAVLLEPKSPRILAMTSAAAALLGDAPSWLERVHPADRAFVENACTAGSDAHVVFRATIDDLRFRVLQIELRRRGETVFGVVIEPHVPEAPGEPQLEALLEALPFEVWERDVGGVLISQNATAKNNWNARLGSTVADLKLPAHVDALWKDLNRRAFAGEVVSAPIDYDFDGRRVNVINIVAPVRHGNVIRGIVGVNVDITEQRKALDDLAAAQSQLVRRERLAALGELAAVVAHEVRNPLAAIFNSIATLKRQLVLDDNAAILFRILEEEAGRLNRTVGDLLNYVRPLVPDRRPDDLVELAREVVRQIEGRSDGIESEVISESKVEPVSTDPVLMRIALSNLVTNAVQAMPDGGKLTVTVSHANGDAVAIAVRDTGGGIPSNVLPRVFEPFFTTRASGAGLGLAVVRRIVEAHDGQVHAESDADRGTVFTVVLPRS